MAVDTIIPAKGRGPLQETSAAQEAGVALFSITSWVMERPSIAPLAREETLSSRQVIASGRIAAGSLPQLDSLRRGQRIQIPVRQGKPISGRVNLVARDAGGWVRVGGELEQGRPGSFMLSQKGGEWNGLIRLTGSKKAYVINRGTNGSFQVLEKPISSVQCASIPLRRDPGNTGSVRTGLGSTMTSSTLAVSPVIVPSLDSLPAAVDVIYLDFDGQTVTNPDWNNGNSIIALPSKIGTKVISPAFITDVWKRVVEDYKPYNISITTDVSRYTAAVAGHRMRCIITSTDAAAPGAGGVAVLESYHGSGTEFSSDVPCWAFTSSYYLPRDISSTISHELGHTMGLSHDGLYPDSDPDHVEYYEGHGSGVTSWAPIMGVTYYAAVGQWCKGEYAHANNGEDDLAIIGGAVNGFGLRSDEVASTVLPDSAAFSQSGIITGASDIDLYNFSTLGGLVTLNANSVPLNPSLDIKLELREADGATLLKSSNLATTLGASIVNYNVPEGTYVIAISGTGVRTADTGYTAYGSVGTYNITGTFPPVPDVAPVITGDPADVAAPPGTKVTFQVLCKSNTRPTYKWTKDGTVLPGQIKNSLVLPSAQIVNQGLYRCEVTNSKGTTISGPAALTINYKPVFTLQPAAKTTIAGTDVTFTAACNGTPMIGYQWQHDRVNVGIPGATLTVTNPQWASMGSYRCIATNTFGSSISNSAVLTVTSPPVILVQPPVTFLAPLSGSTSFGLTAAGTGPLSYQWFKGTAKITGANHNILALSGITTAAAAAYHCEVKNAQGMTISNDCTLSVQGPPVIVTPLSNLTVAKGGKTTLNVAAIGAPPLKYEWFKDDVKVLGTASAQIILNIEDADYRVVVTNTSGTVSSTAHITVHDAPKIISSPATQTRAFGGTADFTVIASGTAPLSYQWFKNAIPLLNQTSDALHLSGLAAADAATYTVAVSNDASKATSFAAKLSLLTSPSIVNRPASTISAFAFAPVTFTVTAAGSSTLKYQWLKNSTLIPGATTATYKIASAQITDNASYSLRVTNSVGSTESAPSTLTVISVAPPIIAAFTPPVGVAGHFVRIAGTNLAWTSGVTLLNKMHQPLKAAFVIVSNTELLVTVPAGSTTSAISVTGRGGSSATASPLTIAATGNTNDDFGTARLMSPAGTKLTGSNVGFTAEPSEPSHAASENIDFPSGYLPVHSAWVQWVPTTTSGYFVSTAGSNFDTRVAIYSGTSMANLRMLGENDDLWESDLTSRAYFVGESGTTYYIAIDGFNYTYEDENGDSQLYDEEGTWNLIIAKDTAAIAPLAVHAPSTSKLQDSKVEATEQLALTATAGMPAIASLQAVAPFDPLHLHTTFSFGVPSSSSDALSFLAYSATGQPLLGLSIDTRTGGLSVLDYMGTLTSTGQTLVADRSYELDLMIASATGLWSGQLNGVWICKDLAVPAYSGFGGFAAQAIPLGKSPATLFLGEPALPANADIK